MFSLAFMTSTELRLGLMKLSLLISLFSWQNFTFINVSLRIPKHLLLLLTMRSSNMSTRLSILLIKRQQKLWMFVNTLIFSCKSVLPLANVMMWVCCLCFVYVKTPAMLETAHYVIFIMELNVPVNCAIVE